MRLGDSDLDLSQPQVMTIVNVTDDSFFAGSRTIDKSAIVSRVQQALVEGATMFDVGGYSSRPGAKELSVEEEWNRVRIGLQAVRSVSKSVPVSVDTFRSEVARRAVEEFGELIINDISAGELDNAMIDVVAKYNLPYVAMHMRGTPQTMQSNTHYENGVVEEVCQYFERKCTELKSRGVERIILDPGFGFAKSLEQNYELLANLGSLCAMGI